MDEPDPPNDVREVILSHDNTQSVRDNPVTSGVAPTRVSMHVSPGDHLSVLTSRGGAAEEDQFSDGFRDAGQAVLRFLSTRIPFGLWMLTRVDGQDQIVLQSMDRLYGVSEGNIFIWSDTYCSRMVVGEAPRVAPRSEDVPAFVMAQTKQSLPIKSYIGVPIVRSDGSLFGTLCAIDPHVQSPSLIDEQPLIELLALLLGSLLQRDVLMLENHRRAERAELASLSDALTEVGNRRAWDRLMETEEHRLSKLGDPASIIVLDLDNLKAVNDRLGHAAGDDALRAVARCLSTVVRTTDFLARVGGDEFAILALDVGGEQVDEFGVRIQKTLEDAGIAASVGWSSREQASGLASAWREADARMYETKAQRRKAGHA